MAAIDRVLVRWGPGETRLALCQGDRIVELAVARAELVAGAVFLGRVVEVSAALNAAFVDIGAARPGFLPGAKGVSQGQALLVQVRADAQGGKGATLSAELSLPDSDRAEIEARQASAKAPALVWRPDPLARALADHPEVTRVVVDDPALYAECRHRFGALVTLDAVAVAESGFDEAFDAALDPVVALPGGGRLIIEPAAALTAIDVDSGGGKPADANRAAVEEVARQLRLRGIGGQVVIDFIPYGGRGGMFKLAAALKRAVADDPVPTHVFGVSALGLVELTRERHGPSLAELMSQRHTGPGVAAIAYGALRRAVAEAAHRPGRALAVVAAPEVTAFLTAAPQAVAEAEARLGARLAFRAEPGRQRQDVLIEERT